MPYKIKFNKKYFEVIVSGKITLNDYRSFFEDLTNHKDWNENLKVLFDFRQAEWNDLLNYSGMESIAGIIYKFKDRLGNAIMAAVFADKKMLPYSNIEESIRKYHNHHLITLDTTNYEEAVIWLDADKEVLS